MGGRMQRCSRKETVKTVKNAPAWPCTPLKRGVNESIWLADCLARSAVPGCCSKPRRGGLFIEMYARCPLLFVFQRRGSGVFDPVRLSADCVAAEQTGR